MTDTRTMARLVEHAWAVADILHGIQGDDDREAARVAFDRVLNTRETQDMLDREAAADGLLASIIGLAVKNSGHPDVAADMKTLALEMHRADYGTPVPMADRGTNAEPYAGDPFKQASMYRGNGGL